MGVNINKAAERKKPIWRRRLQNKIRKGLSQLESSKNKEVFDVWYWQTLERKYSIKVETLDVVTRIEADDRSYCSNR